MATLSGSLRHRAVAACLVAVALLAAACSSSGNGTRGASSTGGNATTPPATGVGTSSNSTPTALKTLTIGTSGDFPPYEFRGPNGDVIGFIPDILDYVLPKIGYKYNYVQVSFAGLPAALQSGRIDMITALYDTPSRREAIAFADFAEERDGIIIRASDKGKITTWSDLCGKTVGAIVGSPILPVTVQNGSQTACVAKGKPPIKNATYQSDAQELRDLANGRIDAGIDGASVFGYAAKQSAGKFALGFVAGNPAIEGWAVKKGNPILSTLAEGLQKFLDDPSEVKKVSDKWGLPDGFFMKTVNTVQ